MPGRFAVVVGINYRAPTPGQPPDAAERAGLNPLYFAEADARDMAALLGRPEEGFDVKTLIGPAATRRAIIDTLIAQSEAAQQAGGLLVVHFSGHGDLDPRNRQFAYLLPADADPRSLVATAIRLDHLRDYLGGVPYALTLLDCCHSGYAVGLKSPAVPDEELGQAFGQQAQSVFAHGRGRIVLAACAGDQRARELTELRHGAFTHYALEHWRTGTRVTDHTLYEHIVAGLEAQGLPRPVWGGVQEGIILLRAAGAPPPVVAAPPGLTWQQRDQLYDLLLAAGAGNLRRWCVRFGIPYPSLEGEDLEGRVESLIGKLEGAGRRDDVAQILAAEAARAAVAPLPAPAPATPPQAPPVPSPATGEPPGPQPNRATPAVALFLDYENVRVAAPPGSSTSTIARALRGYAARFGEVAACYVVLDPRDRHGIAAARRDLEAAGFEIRLPPHPARAGGKNTGDFTLLELIGEEGARLQPDVYILATGDSDYYERVRNLLKRGHAVRVIAMRAALASVYAGLAREWAPDAVAGAGRRGTLFVDTLDELLPAPPAPPGKPGGGPPVASHRRQAAARTSTPPPATPTAALPPAPAGPIITPAAPASLLDLRGYFVLPALTEQGMVRRLGRGVIREVQPLDDEHMLVIAAGGAALFDLRNGAALWEIDCPATCGALSPDRRLLALGAARHIYLWDLRSGRLRHTLHGHTEWVHSVAWAPDGGALASGSGDRTVRVWGAADGTLQHTLAGHGGEVSSVAWAPDGGALASGSEDQTVRVWGAGDGALWHTLHGHTGWVYSVAWAPDGKALASGSDDTTVRVWGAGDGALRSTLAGHTHVVTSVAWAPDGRALASGSYDQTVRVWGAGDGALRRTLAGHSSAVTSVAWAPDGRALASGSDDQTVRVWGAENGALRRALTGHSGGVWSVAWSPDGGALAAGSRDRTVQVWDAGDGALRRTLAGHAGGVTSLAWAPDGGALASGAYDQTVRVWAAGDGALRHTLAGHSSAVTSVAWAPDGGALASGSDDQTVRVWAAGDGALRRTLAGHTGAVQTVAWAPDGGVLASGSYDQTVRLWGENGVLRRTLAGHTNRVISVAWAPDGGALASGSLDQTVRLWNMGDGALRHSLAGHTFGVQSVAWAPDGETLASGSADQTVRVWGVGDGALRRTLVGHTHWVTSVAWAPDGRLLASASLDGTVRIWRVAE